MLSSFLSLMLVGAGGCQVVVAQWQSTGCTSRVSWIRFPAAAGLFTLLYFHPKTSKFHTYLYSSHYILLLSSFLLQFRSSVHLTSSYKTKGNHFRFKVIRKSQIFSCFCTPLYVTETSQFQ